MRTLLLVKLRCTLRKLCIRLHLVNEADVKDRNDTNQLCPYDKAGYQGHQASASIRMRPLSVSIFARFL